MQSILNCLRIAIQNISDFKEEKKTIKITTPDVVNTIYRLIYLSNVSIAFQALSLLLQLVLVQDEQHDRYYNALYRKMMDPGILNANNKITSLYFHIIHRSIQQDSSVPRAKAFLKRLLQMTLSFTPAKACGALIVINKVLKTRPELLSLYLQNVTFSSKQNDIDVKLSKFGDESEGEEMYKDIKLDEYGRETEVDNLAPEMGSSSWIHVNNTKEQKTIAVTEKRQTEYDPFKRAAAYCGAEFSLFYELSLMSQNFHPTVQVFVGNIFKDQKINYYGDPLKDFSLAQFLERFSFKNPKKADPKEQKSAFHQSYQAKGSRGQSVYLLTAQSCTEDEKFIFDFIQRKREIREKKDNFKDERDEDLESVNDDEFDAYLNSLGAANDMDRSDRDFDYMSELKKDSKKITETGTAKKKSGSGSDENEDDWSSIEGGSSDSESELEQKGNESGSDQSFDNGGSSGSEMDSESEVDDETSIKKKTKSRGNDVFVAVEDFSEMIEKNLTNAHGTLGEIFNKDKSSQKQMDWELIRHNSGGGLKRKKSFKQKSFGKKKQKYQK